MRLLDGQLDWIKKDLMVIGALFVISVIGFQIVFYKEPLLSTLRVVAAIYWMFVLPGFAVMCYWSDLLGFAERFIIGIVIAAGFSGTVGYSLGIAGIHVKYHAIILPAAMLIAGIVMLALKGKTLKGKGSNKKEAALPSNENQSQIVGSSHHSHPDEHKEHHEEHKEHQRSE